MSRDVLDLDQVKAWLQSRSSDLVQGVTLTEVRASTQHRPSASADFNATDSAGRINIWVSGEIDFEVIRRSGYSFAFFRHEDVSSMADPRLVDIYHEFLQRMLQPGSNEPTRLDTK